YYLTHPYLALFSLHIFKPLLDPRSTPFHYTTLFRSKISLQQLAAQAGVSKPYLSQIERGLRKPSAEILNQIAKGLRISAEALYRSEEHTSELQSRENLVCRLLLEKKKNKIME